MKSLMIKAIGDAGKLLMRHYGKIKYVKEKDKKSYVTNVDLESDDLIIGLIRKKFPQHNIVSEETGRMDKNSEYTWYIDPIDGTHNYINNFPLFGVSIGLAHKEKIILGAINLPIFKEIYFTERGKGAFLNGKRLNVSNKKDLKKAFVLGDLNLRLNIKANIEMLKKLKGNIYDFRALGCAVIGYTMVAKGNADAYITYYTNSWDAAAGALIVEEANGRVTDTKGNNWIPEQDNFISSNKKLHDRILKLLR